MRYLIILCSHLVIVAILTRFNLQLEKEALEKVIPVEGKPKELPVEVKSQVGVQNIESRHAQNYKARVNGCPPPFSKTLGLAFVVTGRRSQCLHTREAAERGVSGS